MSTGEPEAEAPQGSPGGKMSAHEWLKNPEEMEMALEGLESSPWENLITVTASMMPLQKYCKTALRGLKVQHKKIVAVDKEMQGKLSASEFHEFRERTEKSFSREDEMEQQIASMRETIEDLVAWKKTQMEAPPPPPPEEEKKEDPVVKELQARVLQLEAHEREHVGTIKDLRSRVDDLTGRQENDESLFELLKLQSSKTSEQMSVIERALGKQTSREQLEDLKAGFAKLTDLVDSKVGLKEVEAMLKDVKESVKPPPLPEMPSFDGVKPEDMQQVFEQLHSQLTLTHNDVARLREDVEGAMSKGAADEAHALIRARVDSLEQRMRDELGALHVMPTPEHVETMMEQVKADANGLPRAASVPTLTPARSIARNETASDEVIPGSVSWSIARLFEMMSKASDGVESALRIRDSMAEVEAHIKSVEGKLKPLEEGIWRAGEAASAASQRAVEVETSLKEETSDLRQGKADRGELRAALDALAAANPPIPEDEAAPEVDIDLDSGPEALQAHLTDQARRIQKLQSANGALGAQLMRKTDTEQFLKEMSELRRDVRNSSGGGPARPEGPLQVDIVNPVELKGYAKNEDLTGLLNTIKDMLSRSSNELSRDVEGLQRQVRELGDGKASSSSLDGVRSLLDTSMGELRKALRQKAEGDDLQQLRRELLAQIEAGAGHGGAPSMVPMSAAPSGGASSVQMVEIPAGGEGADHHREVLDKVMQNVLATAHAVGKVQAELAKAASGEELRLLRAELASKCDNDAFKQLQSELLAGHAHVEAKAASALAEGQSKISKPEMKQYVEEKLRDFEATAQPAAVAPPAAEPPSGADLKGVPEALAKALEELEDKMDGLDRMMTGAMEMERRRTAQLEAALSSMKDTVGRKAGRSQMMEEFEKLQAQLNKVGEASARLRSTKAEKKDLASITKLLEGLKVASASDHVMMAGRPVEAWRCLSCDRTPITLAADPLGAEGETAIPPGNLPPPRSPEPRRMRSMHDQAMGRRDSLEENLHVRSMDVTPEPKQRPGPRGSPGQGGRALAGTPPPNFMTGKRDLLAEADHREERMTTMSRTASGGGGGVPGLPPVRGGPGSSSGGWGDDTAGLPAGGGNDGLYSPSGGSLNRSGSLPSLGQ